MTGVAVIGSAMTDLSGKNVSATALSQNAIMQALSDAQVDANQVKAVVVGNMLGFDFDSDPGLDTDPYVLSQGTVRGQVWLKDLGFKDATVINVEAACAGGSTALFVAIKLVQAGLYPVIALGVEQTRVGNSRFRAGWLENCVPRRDVKSIQERLVIRPTDSLFMAFNAQWGQELLDKGLASKEDFAIAAAKARKHAQLDPRAKEKTLLSVQDILNSKVVIREPLTIEMCARFCDGAAAVVLTQDKFSSKGPLIRSCENIAGNGLVDYHVRIKQVLDLALANASVDISDINVAEVHDATSIEEVYSTEALGFFQPGQGAWAIRSGITSVGGRGPVINASGGLVGRGHPLGATGLCQVVELVEQLRGIAGARQVENARLAVAVNSGGIINGDAGVCGVTVLEARSSILR
jgi:acetyl-CoA C-acetyltransferase